MPASTFRILPTTSADYKTIQSIAHATWPDTFGEILSKAQIDYMLNMMYNVEELAKQVADGVVFKLLLEAQPTDKNTGPRADYPKVVSTRFQAVGYVGFKPDYLPGTTKIHKLYALPEVQGRGYGKALIREVESIARSYGQKTLRLDVNYQNKAIGFYEYLGFEKIERCNTDIGNGYLMEDWIMEKGL